MPAPIDAAWFVAGPNLVYLAPLGLAVTYMTAYMATGIDFGGDLTADAEADLDADVDAAGGGDLSAGGELHADADLDAEAELEADADLDADAHAGEGAVAASPDATVVEGVAEAVNRDRRRSLPAWKQALLWLGVGQAPLTLLVMIAASAWSVLGFATHLALRDAPVVGSWTETYPAVALIFSVPVALFGAVAITRKIAFTLGKYAPTTKTTIQGKRALVGLVGEAVMPINAKHGLAVLRDQHGTLHQIHCRVSDDATAIPKGRPIRTVSFDPAADVFAVVLHEPAFDPVA